MNSLSPGRALAISRLIRIVGPAKAAKLVRDADNEHRRLNPQGCANDSCPLCIKPAFDEEHER